MPYIITQIYPDGTLTEHILDAHPELEWMQEKVGGWIERTRIPAPAGERLGSYRDMIVNEEGFIRRLPYNPLATALASHRDYSPIVGTVLVFENFHLE